MDPLIDAACEQVSFWGFILGVEPCSMDVEKNFRIVY